MIVCTQNDERVRSRRFRSAIDGKEMPDWRAFLSERMGARNIVIRIKCTDLFRRRTYEENCFGDCCRGCDLHGGTGFGADGRHSRRRSSPSPPSWLAPSRSSPLAAGSCRTPSLSPASSPSPSSRWPGYRDPALIPGSGNANGPAQAGPFCCPGVVMRSGDLQAILGR